MSFAHKIDIYIIPINTNVASLILGEKLRDLGFKVDIEMTNKKIKKSLDYANKEKIPYVIIYGEDEVNNKVFKLKDMFNKNSGNVGYHIIQSFDDNEGTNEQVFEIGCKLAEELFGDRFETIVALHKNTDNLHCHIVVNSVSFVDGKKFNDNKSFLK